MFCLQSFWWCNANVVIGEWVIEKSITDYKINKK